MVFQRGNLDTGWAELWTKRFDNQSHPYFARKLYGFHHFYFSMQLGFFCRGFCKFLMHVTTRNSLSAFSILHLIASQSCHVIPRNVAVLWLCGVLEWQSYGLNYGSKIRAKHSQLRYRIFSSRPRPPWTVQSLWHSYWVRVFVPLVELNHLQLPWYPKKIYVCWAFKNEKWPTAWEVVPFCLHDDFQAQIIIQCNFYNICI